MIFLSGRLTSLTYGLHLLSRTHQSYFVLIPCYVERVLSLLSPFICLHYLSGALHRQLRESHLSGMLRSIASVSIYGLLLDSSSPHRGVRFVATAYIGGARRRREKGRGVSDCLSCERDTVSPLTPVEVCRAPSNDRVPSTVAPEERIGRGAVSSVIDALLRVLRTSSNLGRLCGSCRQQFFMRALRTFGRNVW